MIEALEWGARILTLLGMPAVLIWFLRDRRRQKAAERVADADADVQAEIAPMRIRSTSITTLEAEIAALTRSFESDRTVKDQTIRWLREELEKARLASMAKDKRTQELEDKLAGMQERVAQMTAELAEVHNELRSLRTSS